MCIRDRGAKIVDLVGLVQAHLPHEHAAVLLEADQAGGLEGAERLAHRAARDAEPLGHRRFVELGPDGELAGNAKLLALYRRLVNELSLYRRATLDQSGIPSMSLGEHRAIVDCIAAGQAAAAGRLLREHVIASRERMHRKTGAALSAARPRRARKSA